MTAERDVHDSNCGGRNTGDERRERRRCAHGVSLAVTFDGCPFLGRCDGAVTAGA